MFINGVAFLLIISLTLSDWLSYSRVQLVLITRFFLFRYFNTTNTNDIRQLAGALKPTLSQVRNNGFVGVVSSHPSSL
jgi:hypothetical protein